MAELTQDMVQRRLETTASGSYQPEIPGLPGLVFVKMGLRERGASSRAYSSKLKELMSEGGYFNEALLPTILERTCRENGIDIKVVDQQRAIMKSFYDSIPTELSGPYDQLTEEEVALLSSEEKSARDEAIQERGKKVLEFMQNFYTEDDKKVLAQVGQIEALEQHLKSNTAEHNARKYQMETEILLCARQPDDTDKPYFSSIEEIEELDDTNQPGLVQLYTKWQQFKKGLLPQFFRSDSLN